MNAEWQDWATRVLFWVFVLGPAIWVGKAWPLSYIMEKRNGRI